MSTIINKYKHYIYLSLFLWVIMLIISPDSYLHRLFIRDDSAIFFTSGKALMNGMTPYVDFADSKGPLLWLIYGIGYLLSHYDYTGVFWLSWLSYSITFIFIFKTSQLFLKDKQLAFISSVSMIMFIFFSWFHHEIKSEDWCQPFITATIYYACRMLYYENTKKSDIRNAFFVFGISFTACLLIKFSIAAMLSSVFIYLIYYQLKKQVNIMFSILWSISGALIMALPFVFYLIYIGAFNAFIDEYFINTLITINNSRNQTSYLHELLINIEYADRLFFFVASLIGCCGIWFINRRIGLFLPLVVCMFWALSTRHAGPHYFNACTSLFVFFTICIVFTFKDFLLKYVYVFTLSLLFATFSFTVITNSFKLGYLYNTFIFTKSPYQQDMEQVYAITSKFHKPKIIFFQSIDRGDGIKAEALPGSTYWTSQLGASKAMVQKQIDDIKAHKADFIVTETRDSLSLEQRINILKSFGYKVAYKFKSDESWTFKRALLIVDTRPVYGNITENKHK